MNIVQSLQREAEVTLWGQEKQWGLASSDYMKIQILQDRAQKNVKGKDAQLCFPFLLSTVSLGDAGWKEN